MVDLTAPATEEELTVLRRLSVEAVYDDDDSVRHPAIVLEPTPARIAALRRAIVTVAAWKGGVGKTELAKELAWLLGGIEVDFDWDAGGASKKWGYNHESRLNAPLLDAFENNRIPKPLQGGQWRADLVPSHPDLEKNQPSPDQTSAAVEKWSAAWGRAMVIDTHPGGTDVGYGAMSASHVIVVPTPLGINELEALESMVKELRGYPLLIVPNQNLYKVPGDKMFERLGRIASTYSVPLVDTPITFCRWLPERTRRMAVAASDPIPARFEEYADQVKAVARAVLEVVAEQMGEEG